MNLHRLRLGVGSAYEAASYSGLGLGAASGVSLENNSGVRAYPLFYVGDPYTLTITGPPNTAINVQGYTNGQPNPRTTATSFGMTDANGIYTYSGIVQEASVGQEEHDYNINGVPIGSISYTVSDAPPAGSSPTPPVPSPPQTPIISSPTIPVTVPVSGSPGGYTAGGVPIPVASPPTGSQTTSATSTSSSTFDFSSIPTWGWVAIGGVILLMMSRR